jgi:hypothetical protein
MPVLSLAIVVADVPVILFNLLYLLRPDYVHSMAPLSAARVLIVTLSNSYRHDPSDVKMALVPRLHHQESRCRHNPLLQI